MPDPNPRIERLKAMLGLEEKRAILQKELDALTAQLSSLKDHLFDETPVTIAKPAAIRVKRAGKGRAQRGALKEQIVGALQNAGSAGVRVNELAAALGTKAANIHAWFHSTAKRIPGITKVSGGHYRMEGKAPVPAEAEISKPAKLNAPATQKTKTSRAKGKRKGTKRGGLSDTILSSLKAAGNKGLTIKELSEKTGAKYRNISVWFVTTGKKYPKLKKLAPAHYKLAA